MIGPVELTIFLAVLFTAVWAVFGRSRYHKIAEQTLAAHEATERRLAEITDALSTMRDQLASLERVLTQID